MSITDGKAAFIRAFKTGAVQAWMDGKAIQHNSDSLGWRPPANDDLPSFWDSSAIWRVKPAEPPQILWRHLDREKPINGQACIISNGTHMFQDNWNLLNGLPDTPDDWESCQSSSFKWWMPTVVEAPSK